MLGDFFSKLIKEIESIETVRLYATTDVFSGFRVLPNNKNFDPDAWFYGLAREPVMEAGRREVRGFVSFLQSWTSAELGADTICVLRLEQFKKMLALGRDYKGLSSTLRRLVELYPEKKGEMRKLFGEEMNAYLATNVVVQSSGQYSRLEGAVSFRALMALRTRRMSSCGRLSCPEWVLNDKLFAWKFVSAFGLRVPGSKRIGASINLNPSSASVIKPRSGGASKGVFLMHSPDNVVEVKTGQVFRSIDEVKARMQALLAAGIVKVDDWLIEKLVYGDRQTLEPARDLKFWCFYGEVLLVREVARIAGEVWEIWTDAKGNPVEIGQKFGERLVDRGGFGDAELEMVKQISLSIPAPFMRIDFLVGDEGISFGEFTPRPGSFAQFSRVLDYELGDAFIRAEARLQQDLLVGKRFDQYMKFAG